MRNTVTYLPDVYREFQKRYPGIAAGYDQLARDCHRGGPLDARTRRLIKLGIAIGLGSEGGVRSHARRALYEGISVEELRHAVLLTMTTAGFPAMMAATKWIDTVIENHLIRGH